MGNDSRQAARGWRQWREEDARDALAEFARSGKSLAKFSRDRGISVRRLVYWRKRLGDGRVPEFVPVRMPSAGSSRTEAGIEIAFDGVTIRVPEDTDAEVVAQIAASLVRRSRAGC
jgi:hypothetical protein